ncbi:MAG TPA: hypothetical protein PKZ76_08275 [Xanthomonadaceae bacterium]|nr:hypothetical protein [Xanthomonadaceae bacterium]
MKKRAWYRMSHGLRVIVCAAGVPALMVSTAVLGGDAGGSFDRSYHVGSLLDKQQLNETEVCAIVGENTVCGHEAGANLTTGSTNSFFGRGAGMSVTDGMFNSFFGHLAGRDNIGYGNSFFGAVAGAWNTTGYDNVFVGDSAGYVNSTGYRNTYVGTFAGSDSNGSENVFVGRAAGYITLGGSRSTYLGRGAGLIHFGDRNTFVGYYSGHGDMSDTRQGSRLTFLGGFAGGSDQLENATAVGYQAFVSQSNSLVLGSIPGVNELDPGFPNQYVNVGIGTDAPMSALHVQRTDGTARISVINTVASLPPSSAELEVRRPGGAKIDFGNTVGSDSVWRVGHGGEWIDGRRFVIETKSSSAREHQLELRENGNLLIAGTLSQGSSRAIKSEIVKVAAEAVLDKLSSLPVFEWSYSGMPEQRHVGPMAEDFYTAFGLGGSDTHIAPGDMAGVALAAVSALNERSQQLEAENGELRGRLDELRGRLEQIESMLVKTQNAQ